MTWNHRVVRDKDGNYSIREVYYNVDGRVEGFTSKPIPSIEENLADLRLTLERMLKACDEKVIEDNE